MNNDFGVGDHFQVLRVSEGIRNYVLPIAWCLLPVSLAHNMHAHKLHSNALTFRTASRSLPTDVCSSFAGGRQCLHSEHMCVSARICKHIYIYVHVRIICLLQMITAVLACLLCLLACCACLLNLLCLPAVVAVLAVLGARCAWTSLARFASFSLCLLACSLCLLAVLFRSLM